MGYYCKRCKYVIGVWDEKIKNYVTHPYCYQFNCNENSLIKLLDCKRCEKFVGLKCYNVCDKCYGKDIICEEKKLFKWFKEWSEYSFLYSKKCYNCYKKYNRYQCWFFGELTFFI